MRKNEISWKNEGKFHPKQVGSKSSKSPWPTPRRPAGLPRNPGPHVVLTLSRCLVAQSCLTLLRLSITFHNSHLSSSFLIFPHLFPLILVMCSVFWSGSRRCCAEKYGTRGEQAVNTGQHNLRHGNMDMFHHVSMCLCGLLSQSVTFPQFSTFPLGGCVESPGACRHSTGRQASELTLAASGRTEELDFRFQRGEDKAP